MADIEKPLRDLATEEAPQVVSLSKEAWESAMNRPELRNLLDKFDITKGPQKVTVTSKDPDAVDKLRDAFQAPNFTLPGGTKSVTPEVEGVDFNPTPPKGTDLKSGLRDGTGLDNLPATTGSSSNLPAPTTGGSPPPTSSLGTALKLGAAGAAVGGAAYGASQMGGGDMPARGGPAGTPLANPDAPLETQMATGAAQGKLGVQPLSSVLSSTPDKLPDVSTPPPPKPDLLQTHFTAAHYEAPQTAIDALKKLKANPPQMEAAGAPGPDGRGATKPITDADAVVSKASTEAFNLQEKQIRDIARDALRTNSWAQVAEKMGQALTQLFAARRGLATGVNMSNLTFEKTDWIHQNQQVIDLMKEDLGIAEKQRGAEEKRVKTIYDTLESYRKQLGDANREVSQDARSTAEMNSRADTAAMETGAGNARANLSSSTQVYDTGVRAQTAEKDAAVRADASTKNTETRAGATLGAAETRAGVGAGKQTDKQADAAAEAASTLTGISKLPSKQQGAQFSKSLYLLGRAHVPAEEIQKWQDEATGILGGIDYDKFAASAAHYLKQNPASETTPSASTVKVKGPSGETADMTPENAKKYLAQPGYTQVK